MSTPQPSAYLSHLPPRARWLLGVARLTLAEPAEAVDRTLVRVREAVGNRPSRVEYEAEPAWEEWLHRQLGAAWPCPAQEEFEALWPDVADYVRGQGLAFGRASYGGCDDADPGLARALWCLTAHLRPEKVVETGVAHGVTSRFILERLRRNGTGYLWSIDLPDVDVTRHGQIGAAVPPELRERWTLIEGTSRHRLEPLLEELGGIDLFLHDSSHTERNVRFELARAWQALGRGAIVVDDVHRNRSWEAFTRVQTQASAVTAYADDRGALFGIALKPAVNDSPKG